MRLLVGQNRSAIVDQIVTISGTTWPQRILNFGRTLAAGTSVDIYVQDWTGTLPPTGATLLTLFADSFVDADNWSWAPINAASTNPVKVGSRAIAVTANP